MSIEGALRCGLVAAVLADVGLGLLVHRVSVGDQGGLLAGLVVAHGAGERLVVKVDHLELDIGKLGRYVAIGAQRYRGQTVRH